MNKPTISIQDNWLENYSMYTATFDLSLGVKIPLPKKKGILLKIGISFDKVYQIGETRKTNNNAFYSIKIHIFYWKVWIVL